MIRRSPSALLVALALLASGCGDDTTGDAIDTDPSTTGATSVVTGLTGDDRSDEQSGGEPSDTEAPADTAAPGTDDGDDAAVTLVLLQVADMDDPIAAATHPSIPDQLALAEPPGPVRRRALTTRPPGRSPPHRSSAPLLE